MARSIEWYEKQAQKLHPKASKESIGQAAVMAHFVELTIEATAKAMVAGLLKSKPRQKKRKRGAKR